MKKHDELIYAGIMRDMSEGVMTIGMDGVIGYINPKAEEILGLSAQALAGKKFAACFFLDPRNDAFNQMILDAIYDRSVSHEGIVPYASGEAVRQLRIKTSFLRSGEEKIGVVAVFDDVSELHELRDAVKAMQRIQALNAQLTMRNELLSETFGRFLSDDIVRELLDTPQGLLLGGKKRLLTIMMSDLRGFTAISEQMPADALIAMLNHYLGEMTEIIQSHNGTIVEFIGDGIMAIFGAPAALEDHAADAAAAAVQMQSRMKAVNEWNAQRGYPALEMGVALNTGEVIVGNIGSSKRTKYGVVGSEVNLCGRIESYSVGGQILVSPSVRSHAGAPLLVREEIPVSPKGVRDPFILSRIAGVGEPYNVYLEEETLPPLVPLDPPAQVSFLLVSSKHCEGEMQTGCLAAAGETGALLFTGMALSPLDNIRLQAGGDLFAKVIRRENGGWLLRFTSVPAGYGAWIAERRDHGER